MLSFLSHKVGQPTLDSIHLFSSLALQNLSASAKIKAPAPKSLPPSSIFRAASLRCNNAWNSQQPKKIESESIYICCCLPKSLTNWPMTSNCVFAMQEFEIFFPFRSHGPQLAFLLPPPWWSCRSSSGQALKEVGSCPGPGANHSPKRQPQNMRDLNKVPQHHGKTSIRSVRP